MVRTLALLASLVLATTARAQEGQAPPPGGAPPPTAAEPAAPAPAAPTPTQPAPPKVHRFALGLWGALPFGEHLATAITPVEASYQVNSMDFSYAFGLVIDYAFTPEIHAFLDGGLYSQSVEVAKPGSYGTSFWVYEQMGYTGNHTIGPFADGARYYMDTTAMRLGGAYHMGLGSVDAYAGLTFGFYSWTATYGTPDRSGKWGQASGLATGITYLFGADVPLGDVVKLGLFLDLASPGVDYTMNDLFKPGWTWSTGHHVMGPYRAGIRVLMPM